MFLCSGHISAADSKANYFGEYLGKRSVVGTIMKNPIWAICERLSEIQAVIESHLETGTYRTDEVAWLISEILSEDGLREAMDTVGYLPPNAPRH